MLLISYYSKDGLTFTPYSRTSAAVRNVGDVGDHTRINHLNILNVLVHRIAVHGFLNTNVK